MEETKDGSNECQFTINLSAIIDLLPQKYTMMLASHKYGDSTPKKGLLETVVQTDGQENPQLSETTTIAVHEATPESKTTNETSLKDKYENTEDTMTTDPISPYVVDRVELIATEIENCQINESE